MTSRRFTATVELPVAADVAFVYLCDPRNRPQWQSSLRSVQVAPGEEPHVGQAWSETTSLGVRPQMETTELEPYRVWVERGRWRGVRARLGLHFTQTAGGCRVRAEGEVTGSGPYGLAALAAGTLASTAIAGDLRRAGRILQSRDNA